MWSGTNRVGVGGRALRATWIPEMGRAIETSVPPLRKEVSFPPRPRVAREMGACGVRCGSNGSRSTPAEAASRSRSAPKPR